MRKHLRRIVIRPLRLSWNFEYRSFPAGRELGERPWLPSGVPGKQYRRLCAALGDESASALCREFARRAIYIPNLKKAMLDKRNSSLNMERDELTGKGHSERALVAILARRYGLSERQIWRILKQPRTPGEATQ
ncbi:MAG: Mor transcription activator family protein [Bilophila wadsworthia]